MNIRWMAVLTGVMVDLLISLVLGALVPGGDMTQSIGSPLLAVSVVMTTVSGYVAGRLASEHRTMHGLLVQVLNILLAQLGPPLPRPYVLALAAACGFAALGGFLSRFPAPQSSTR